MTTFKFTEHDHARLATLFIGASAAGPVETSRATPGIVQYRGYKPTVREAPNGDTKACLRCRGQGHHGDERAIGPECSACRGTGRVPNVDDGRAAKRWLHVAPKYAPPDWAMQYYDRAFAEACRVATALGVPAAYRPHEAYGALRVLEYPSAAHTFAPNPTTIDGKRNRRKCGCHKCTACGVLQCIDAAECEFPPPGVCPALAPGAGTVEHTDPDLLTIVLWRSTPADLERTRVAHRPEDWAAEAISPGLHIGEIGELVGLGPATPHRVPARPYVQKSLIYFAIPDHAARLPGGRYGDGKYPTHADEAPTVGEWLDDAMKRRRYEAQP